MAKAVSPLKSEKAGDSYLGIERSKYPEWAGWKIIDDAGGVPEDTTLLNILAENFYKLQALVKQLKKSL